VQRNRVLVRFKVFAVAQPFALKSLQFLTNAQKCPFNMAVVRLSKVPAGSSISWRHPRMNTA
jgi:hypothetical protein